MMYFLDNIAIWVYANHVWFSVPGVILFFLSNLFLFVLSFSGDMKCIENANVQMIEDWHEERRQELII